MVQYYCRRCETLVEDDKRCNCGLEWVQVAGFFLFPSSIGVITELKNKMHLFVFSCLCFYARRLTIYLGFQNINLWQFIFEIIARFFKKWFKIITLLICQVMANFLGFLFFAKVKWQKQSNKYNCKQKIVHQLKFHILSFMNSLYDPNRVQCLNCAEVGFKSLPCKCTQNIWIHWIAIFLCAIAFMIFIYSLNYWNVGYGICFILLSILFFVVAIQARNYRRNQRKKNNFEKPLIMFGLPPQSNQKVQMSEQLKQETDYPKN